MANHALYMNLIQHARQGRPSDIDAIMSHLVPESSFAVTRNVDFALSLVRSEAGTDRIHYYLFHGTQIQRNYASLYFNRLGEWKPVKQAFEEGLIDEIQAFSR